MATQAERRSCPVCRAPMPWAELPEGGPVWHCESCSLGLITPDGNLHRWQRSISKIERRDRKERKVMSDKPCPECHRPMWEVVMLDFGSRWQCEHCRLTVFSSGGIQRWSAS